MASLKWRNESAKNPGYSVYYSNPKDDPDVLYVIQQKRKTPTFTPVGWRAFARTNTDDPLRTIFTGDTLAECKQYIQEWDEIRANAQ